ncbi:MAG: transcriptional regulator [Candidatus Syntrophoarchaeum caldarius]|uniref:Transcriptional regulator n=1 Tax=Candidatus Syntropharchaeum caldarium TaxID=1838285 RepID=A0A1F2PCH3_9EURY|nr:MAG: transcriptional regulator [Candidatus Syntrophoarchaeum caldarius]
MFEYSIRHLSRILKSFGMKYSKPYQQDYRRPENAEEELKKT